MVRWGSFGVGCFLLEPTGATVPVGCVMMFLIAFTSEEVGNAMAGISRP